jgi:hypothetical protein
VSSKRLKPKTISTIARIPGDGVDDQREVYA